MGTTTTRPRAAARRARGTTPAPARQQASPPIPSAAVPAPPPSTIRRSLLRPLGIVGYDAIEPAILAALATEEPLLLISEHGAAKTLLLLRLAHALGLELRHYNASLLQFDDLAGFPIPDAQGEIRYAAPPGAIWDAEVAFFDEIGRCRPDVANKLFPIIHERRIQGLPIARLRHRWAATNPPSDAQDAASRFAYEAVETLDPALADRFSWIVALPHFGDFSDADRRAIIGGVGERPTDGAHLIVRELVSTARALIPGIQASASHEIATYIDLLIARLGIAGIPIGGRRAATLFRNVVAMRAAHLALGLSGDAHACLAAVLTSMPDSVRRVIPRTTLQTAHEAAWRQVSLADDDPLRTLLAVRDPLQRALLALTLPALPVLARGEALCSALAALTPIDAATVAWFVLPHLLERPLVSLAATETVAGLVSDIAFDGVTVRGYTPHRTWALALRTALSHTTLGDRDAEFLHGVIAKHAAPRPQLTGAVLPSPDDLIAHLLSVRDACVAALGPAWDEA